MTFAIKIDAKSDATFVGNPLAILRVGFAAAQAFAGKSTLQPFLEAVAQSAQCRAAGFVRLGNGDRLTMLAAMRGFDASLAWRAVGHLREEMVGRCIPLPTRSGFGAALVLAQAKDATDLLIVPHGESDLLSALGDELAQRWRDRAPSVAAIDEAEAEASTLAQDILSPANPYALTAAEIRICTLLTQGMKPAQMAATLNCAMPTIRTHLSSIYAKTGLPGMVQVVCALTGGPHRGSA